MERDDGQLHDWVGLMLATLEGHPATHSLPLDVQATTFQRRVWQHLMTIPRGETGTYRQVAEALGEPRSTRAVANACAANPVALVVPCLAKMVAWAAIAGDWNGNQPFWKRNQ